MPFRERVKRALGRSGSMSDSSSLKKTITKDSNTYQAGETIPKPKYRGPVDPHHKAKLEGFSFGTSWRHRNSIGSLYSPFGSRLPSRNNSISESRKFFGRGPSNVQKVMENQDDSGDIINVGGTRHASTEQPPSRPAHSTSGSTEPDEELAEIGAQETYKSYADDHRPFTEADVNNALRRVASRRS